MKAERLKELIEKEFSNIEKVVKMPVPPTWEEFKKLKIFEIRTIYAKYELELYENTKQLVLTGDYVGTKYSRLMLSYLSTEENYIKALRKMVELFKEKV